MTDRPSLSDAHASPDAFAIISRRELHDLRNRCHAAEGLLTLAKIENAELTAQRDEAVAELGRLRLSLSPTQDDPKRLGLVDGAPHIRAAAFAHLTVFTDDQHNEIADAIEAAIIASRASEDHA